MGDSRKYRLGVVGLGEGRSIISAALQSEMWELVNICDLNEELCHERMNEFGLTRYTADYEELLGDDGIDVIAIYTPDQLHGLHIRQALEAGKHVICTKPLLLSLDEAKDLLECRRKYNRHVFVGQSSRFFEPMIRQREDFEKGLHGELISVEAHYNTDARWFLQKGWSRKKGFSWMYNFMIHAVDLVRWYLPDITEVYGCGAVSPNTREYGLECYDTMKVLFTDKRGRFGLAGGSYAVPCRGIDPTIACTIRGTNGTTKSEYPRLVYHTNFADKGYQMNTYEEKHGYYFRFEGESHHAGEYQNYIEYFAKSLDNNEIPKPDLEEGIVTIAVLAATERSLETGMPVKVNDVLREYGLSELEIS